jgi:response regulator NasT
MGESAIICMKKNLLFQNVKAGLKQMGFTQIIETDDLENLLRLTHSLKNSLVIFDPSEYGTNGVRVSKVLAREKMGPLIFIISNKRLVKPIEEITERDSWGATYITTPLNFETLRVVVRMMIQSYKKILELEKKLLEVNEVLAEKKKINIAKELLIKQRQISEPEAHKLIQRISMKTGKSLKVVSEKIIKELSL